MRKLLLVNPVAKKSGYLLSRFSTFAPLGLGYVAGMTPGSWEIRLIDENFDSFVYEEADLVAISAFTSNINRAYEIAAQYRKNGIKVVIGGIHASMEPDEVSSYADAVVVGEVESTWNTVLEDFENGSLKKVYRAPPVDLGNVHVKPRRDIFHPGYFWNSVQTSRGCPFNCMFCSVTRYLGRDYRQRKVDDVLEELSEIDGRYVAFVDDNLIGYSEDSRERAKKLFRGMIDGKMNKRWWMQTSINAVQDEEVLRLAARAGCMFAFIGFETIKEELLKEMRKGVNMAVGVDNYSTVVKSLHRHGIGVMGGFILGNDYESAPYYREFAKYLLHSGIDICQISLLTPLPGTKLMETMKSENRLIHNAFPGDWTKYRLSRIVHQLKGVTPEGVYRGDNYIKKKIYSPFAFVYRMVRSAVSLNNLTSFAAVYQFNRALKKSWENSHYYKNYPADLQEKEALRGVEEIHHGK